MILGNKQGTRRVIPDLVSMLHVQTTGPGTLTSRSLPLLGTGGLARAADPLGPLLPVYTGPLSEPQVVIAARKLKNRKAPGPDEIPGEFWKSICTPGTRACKWAVDLG